MNKNYNQRDKILFGKYDENCYFGGCRHFECSADTIQKLLDEKFIDPEECQNYSPSTQEFINVLGSIEGVVFNGYAISPDRGDYRVTIEGFDADITDTDYDTFIDVVKLCNGADEFDLSHEDGHFSIHAWWD